MRERKKARLKSWLLKSIGTLVFLISIFWILDRFYPLDMGRYQDLSHLILDKQNQLLTALISKDERLRFQVNLNEVDSRFIRILVAYEDKRFFYHYGIDPLAIGRALWQWGRSGRIVSGGSTLTLQTVRLLEPKSRTLIHKLQEALRALQLEYHYSKKEILEIYLSLAPYGGNLEGIRAASLTFFNKDPKMLSISEAALLVALPQQPSRLRLNLYPERARKSRDKILLRMKTVGVLTPTETQEALEDEVPKINTLYSFPRYAGHLAYRLASMMPQQFVHKTFIDLSLQKQCETLLKLQLPFLDKAQTVALMIVENKTRQVVTYVGSAAYFDDRRCGQVDMIKAIRSPGSTLKPFIYGLGFELGVIHPDTIMQDIPTLFCDYAPSNFKDTFHGMVTVKEALQNSLNIPAVSILEKIGPGYFTEKLRKVGVPLKFSNNLVSPSLSLALGGVGVSLEDLVNLYMALANQGEFAKALISGEIVKEKEVNLLENKAAWHVTHILEGTPPPEGFVHVNATTHAPIAYKTGTSYGFRDAWALGFTKDFTVGVWVGRPDGTPHSDQVGRTVAAPILFKVFDILPKRDKNFKEQEPEGILSLKAQELPKTLMHFKRKDIENVNVSKNLKILFPKEGSMIHLEKEEQGFRPIRIFVSGSKPPFYCFENGHPLSEKFSTHEILWQPKELGFTEITVVDSLGASASVTICLR